MSIVAFFKKFTYVQKIFLVAVIATILCSIWTECAFCQRFPIKFSLHNPFEHYEDPTGASTSLTIYHVPWCGFCRQFLASGEVEKLQQALAGTPIVVKMVDGEAQPDAAKAAGVDSYPTIQLMKNGQSTNYEGSRDADSIVKWIQLQ